MDATKNAVRILGLSALITATMISPRSFYALTRADIQVIIAAVVIFTILFVDHIFGFILGLSALVLYSRVFMDKYGISPRKALSVNVTDYITPKNLEDAQSNVFDAAKVNEPYKGVSGVYGEAVYSAQGLDMQLPGLEKALGQDF